MHTHHHRRNQRFITAALVLCALPCTACDDPASDLASDQDPMDAPAATGNPSQPPHPPHPPHPHDPDDSSTGGSSDGDSPDADSSDGGGAPGDSSGDGDPPVDPPADAFLEGFFPIGIFAPTVPDMQGWADIGCNTMLSVPQGHDAWAWDQQAQSLGLKVIRRPLGGDPNADAGRTDLLAWMLPDEPDVEANNGPCGGSCVELAESWSAQWRAVDPNRKIFVNLAGPNVLLKSSCDYCNGPGDDPPVAACYPENDQCYPRIIDAADWVSQDIYPVTGWLPSEQMRDDIKIVGGTLDRIRDWTAKPLFAIVEVSDQRLGFPGTGSRGPTPDEFRAELWHAIIHGARGVFYFPEAFNPFEFDNTEPDMRDEMAVQHAVIADLAPVLQGEIEPAAMSASADEPLELTWRQSADDGWLFVLNTSPQAVTGHVQVDGFTGNAEVHGESRTVQVVGGAFTDGFAPYEVHVYRLPGA